MEEKTDNQGGNLSISAREREVLEYWRERNIFQKSLQANSGKAQYVFYDGPPFATGLPHYGHLLQGTIKDVIPRFQTMRGRFVRREWGWDCHGLPIENLIEKELGLKQKSDIEAYGIGAFNQRALESVLMYDKEWRTIVPRMGRWVDMDHEYKTMDATYTESVWWAFKTLYDKNLIYEGFKSMHICPRCETTLASSEVAQGYKDVKDISVYVKFELVDEPGTFMLAWTTTPWTLPGNVAVAVNPHFLYSVVHHAGARYILAKDLVEKVFSGKEYQIEGERSGEALIGLAYKPLFDYYTADTKLENREHAWKVVPADFVTIDSGTGVVHEAPAFGEEDMELAKVLSLPMIQHVGMDGRMKPEVRDFAGMSVKPKSDDDKERLATDIAVLRYLQEHGTFFAKENIVHSYPHCWRCDTPLLNYAASSWFVNVGKLKPKLLAENAEISWVPDHIRDGRFGRWLEGARDWSISRSRYWGAPLPVWKCDACDHAEVLGSVAALKEKIGTRNTFIMMRHGEAESNIRGVVSYKPEDEIHLTERGREEAKRTGGLLKGRAIDLIITSPLKRTKETAQIVAEAVGISSSAIIEDARLSEVNTGEFNGCPIETYREYFTSTLEKFSKPSPGGETLTQMKERIAQCLYDLDATYEGKNILLVTHEYGTWMMDAVAQGATVEEAAWMRSVAGDDYVEFAEARDLPFVQLPHNARHELDLHRPHIDAITYTCACRGVMRRIPEVFDCWFESGSMPFAQFHFMGDERTKEGRMFTKNFPADFIGEAVDQTRGWFYSMLVLSVGLFGRSAYKSVITTGLILAEDGQKMSKKLKNYPDPLELAEKYGADAIRFYMLNSPVVRGEELRFAVSGVEEVVKKVTLRVDNVRAFFALHAGGHVIVRKLSDRTHILDKWIIARFHEVHAEVTHHLDTHELDKATRPIMPFLDDLSTWYIRRSRERFKHQSNNPSSASLRGPADSSTYKHTSSSSRSPRLASEVSLIDADAGADRMHALETTGWVLLETAKLLAPFMPFLAEDLYRKLSVEGKKESVHLESWSPVAVSPSNILDEMESARRVVSVALEARAKAGIKVRQPLARLTAPQMSEAMRVIVADEVNVKEVATGDAITLDLTITPELKEEGDMRDLVREIQDMRKKEGLHPDDRIHLTVPDAQSDLLKKFEREIFATVGAISHSTGHTLGIKRA